MKETHDDQLSVEAAGKIVGISPRTLRVWIAHGKLPASAGRRGKLVRLADVLALVTEEDQSAHDNHAVALIEDASSDNAIDQVPVSHPIVDSLLAELRDGVIWPLAERLEMLAQENGRIAAERDAAVRGRDELIGRFGTDHRFVDRLVELLQEDLDNANHRIAELEAENLQLRQHSVRADTALHPAAKALLLLRKRR